MVKRSLAGMAQSSLSRWLALSKNSFETIVTSQPRAACAAAKLSVDTGGPPWEGFNESMIWAIRI
jgi:hypothetical protein